MPNLLQIGTITFIHVCKGFIFIFFDILRILLLASFSYAIWAIQWGNYDDCYKGVIGDFSPWPYFQGTRAPHSFVFICVGLHSSMNLVKCEYIWYSIWSVIGLYIGVLVYNMQWRKCSLQGNRSDAKWKNHVCTILYFFLEPITVFFYRAIVQIFQSIRTILYLRLL